MDIGSRALAMRRNHSTCSNAGGCGGRRHKQGHDRQESAGDGQHGRKIHGYLHKLLKRKIRDTRMEEMTRSDLTSGVLLRGQVDAGKLKAMRWPFITYHAKDQLKFSRDHAGEKALDRWRSCLLGRHLTSDFQVIFTRQVA